tara:strand:- start:212 stop:1321 length:1110 start_codon:yes stop_codon:yes gene_type:complete
MKAKIINIKTKQKNYKIYFGEKLIKNFKSILQKEKIKFNKSLIVLDSKISSKYFKIIKKSINGKKFLLKINSTEKNKNFYTVIKISKLLLKHNFSRNDCLISIGGGIIGDMCSFTASIFKRGMKYINIPSTLLAQVDSSIGGKTGVNDLFYGKNLIGTFYQPDLVLSDTSILKTLSKKELVCGYAEILKHSLIDGKKNFNYLDKHNDKILNLENPYLINSIVASCKIKKNIIEKDVFEKNFRKTLNLGHTFGHAYEAASGYKKGLNHGEGVILGIKTSIKFSLKEKLITKKNYDLIYNHIKNLGFSRNLSKIFTKKDIAKLISYMRNDKKNNSDKINLILLKNIGRTVINNLYSSNKLKKFFYKELINL